jgi:hypothetical protein
MDNPEAPQHPPADFAQVRQAPPGPSAAERQKAMQLQLKRRRRRGFLLGLLAGQLLIIGLDLGGTWFLKTHPQVKLQAPFGVASIVFLGMAASAAAMLVAVALIYSGMALRSMFGRRVVAAAGNGIVRIFATAFALSVTIGVIIGTAWFMIPHDQRTPTLHYAQEQGGKAVDASKAKVQSILRTSPR